MTTSLLIDKSTNTPIAQNIFFFLRSKYALRGTRAATLLPLLRVRRTPFSDFPSPPFTDKGTPDWPKMWPFGHPDSSDPRLYPTAVVRRADSKRPYVELDLHGLNAELGVPLDSSPAQMEGDPNAYTTAFREAGRVTSILPASPERRAAVLKLITSVGTPGMLRADTAELLARAVPPAMSHPLPAVGIGPVPVKFQSAEALVQAMGHLRPPEPAPTHPAGEDGSDIDAGDIAEHVIADLALQLVLPPLRWARSGGKLALGAARQLALPASGGPSTEKKTTTTRRTTRQTKKEG